LGKAAAKLLGKAAAKLYWVKPLLSFTLSKPILLCWVKPLLSFTLSKPILLCITSHLLFLFTFRNFIFGLTPNYQRTDAKKLLCIQA